MFYMNYRKFLVIRNQANEPKEQIGSDNFLAVVKCEPHMFVVFILIQ